MIVVRFWCKLKNCTLAGQSLILNMCMKCWGWCICIARIIAESLCNVSHSSDLHIIIRTADDSYNIVYQYHHIFTVKKTHISVILLRLCLLCGSYLLVETLVENCYGTFEYEGLCKPRPAGRHLESLCIDSKIFGDECNFGGLVVSMLASGTQDRGFDFSGEKIHSMPSLGGK